MAENSVKSQRIQGFKDSKGIFGTSPYYKKHRIKIIIKKSTTKYYYTSALIHEIKKQIDLIGWRNNFIKFM